MGRWRDKETQVGGGGADIQWDVVGQVGGGGEG